MPVPPLLADEKRRTLVVVEDQMISRLVRTVLRKHGYPVVVSDPAEAVSLLGLDEPFPGILATNSPAIFLRFAETVPLLYLSSSPDPELEAVFRHCRVVRKPFVPADLVRAVEELSTPRF